MLPRPFTLIPVLAVGLIAQGLTSVTALAQPPAAWQAGYLPALIPSAAGGDPYAVTASPGSGGVITAAAGSWLLGGSNSAGGPLLTTSSLIAPNTTFFPAGPDPASRVWILADYLLWKPDGMNTPPLVTTSPPGTPQNQAAVLGEPGTSILFGSRRVNDNAISGFRVGGGFWVTPQNTFAIESEYFRLGEQVTRYRGGSDGTTIIGRPYFDILNGQQTAQLVSFPGLVSGTINVDAKSNLQSAMINGRASLCPNHGPDCNCGRADRVDWIVGYRFIELEDGLTISENLTSLTPQAPGTISLADSFSTRNEFNGLQLGVVHRAGFQRAWLESMLRVALGGNRQTVRISGNSSLTEGGFTDNFNSGLLALSSNIGTWQRNEFVMVPEIGLKLGMRWTKRFHATIGYSALYLPNVVRAGQQIDTDVNPNLIAPQVDPITGVLRPQVTFLTTDYWVQGLTLGGELRF